MPTFVSTATEATRNNQILQFHKLEIHLTPDFTACVFFDTFRRVCFDLRLILQVRDSGLNIKRFSPFFTHGAAAGMLALGDVPLLSVTVT